MFEIVEIERLSYNKAAAMEGVADLELGIYGICHLEGPFAQMQEAAAAVRLPRHQHAGVLCDVVGIKGVVEDVVGGIAVGGVMFQEVLPVAETHTSGQQRKGSRIGRAVALHVTPDTLEGGIAERVLAAHGNHFPEKGEIGRSGDTSPYGLLYHLAQGSNFFIV